MAGRSLSSPVSAGLAAFSSASRCSGTLLGEVIAAAAPGTNVNPVITPPVLTVTSAVACCHHGFLTECTDPFPPLGTTFLTCEACLGSTGRADHQGWRRSGKARPP